MDGVKKIERRHWLRALAAAGAGAVGLLGLKSVGASPAPRPRKLVLRAIQKEPAPGHAPEERVFRFERTGPVRMYVAHTELPPSAFKVFAGRIKERDPQAIVLGLDPWNPFDFEIFEESP